MDRRLSRHPEMKHNPRTDTVTVSLYVDGDETEVSFPSKLEVCGTCNGKGKHVNPSIDGNGIAQEDFDRDPDFAESYFSGAYDVTCNECEGLRVVPVIDAESLSSAQQADFTLYEDQQRTSAREADYDAYTTRMENGG